ncbi:acid phosphatase [Subtercola boreus]|uniref:Acid phosphatase n=1 Tax=Subtercola boreus TaxID=120213 RepID=A0A3E0VV54_9MICO|nr:phosphatase PAP2 family protein [Subtercola boreus]RFA13369.1 acid phosphatase [Subtercola boreus]
MRRSSSRFATVAVATAVAASIALSMPATASAAGTSPSDTTPPDLITLLAGYDSFWTSDGTNTLHGTVDNAGVLAQNDALTSWINTHATPAQQFLALQDSSYQNADGTAYDQSITLSTALGSVLGPLYVKGRESGDLPLTSALINSSNGTSGAYVSTGAAKAHYSYPRPYLPTDPATAAVPGDAAACAPAVVNASSLTANRTGKSYADANGNLDILRVPAVVDTTHAFSPNDVTLDPGYGVVGICTGGSYPSGHTTTAYEAGVTLATLLPELAPEILTRASEAGNDRIVLGVHYPLDIMGGRIDGEAALATRWSDTDYRTAVLEPARAELVDYLEKATGSSIADTIAAEAAYTSNPYGGSAIPGGTSQIVTDRRSAVAVFTERTTYGFAQTGPEGLAASVPTGAENLLLTTFPTLTDAQRTSVLAQTELDSGYPLDGTGTAAGSWQRLNLAAATSAAVQLNADESVTVVSTGGAAAVLPVAVPTATPTPAPTATSSTAPVLPSATPTAGASGSGQGLAHTGSDVAAVAPWTAGVLGLGLVLAAIAGVRRRRHSRS